MRQCQDTAASFRQVTSTADRRRTEVFLFADGQGAAAVDGKQTAEAAVITGKRDICSVRRIDVAGTADVISKSPGNAVQRQGTVIGNIAAACTLHIINTHLCAATDGSGDAQITVGTVNRQHTAIDIQVTGTSQTAVTETAILQRQRTAVNVEDGICLTCQHTDSLHRAVKVSDGIAADVQLTGVSQRAIRIGTQSSGLYLRGTAVVIQPVGQRDETGCIYREVSATGDFR